MMTMHLPLPITAARHQIPVQSNLQAKPPCMAAQLSKLAGWLSQGKSAQSKARARPHRAGLLDLWLAGSTYKLSWAKGA